MQQPTIEPIISVFEGLHQDLKTRPAQPHISTGIAPLDLLTWGLHRGELLVVGGRPSEGKTSLALYLAYQVMEQSKTVVFLSLEMTKQALLERMFCHYSEMDAWALRKGHLPDDYEVRQQAFRTFLNGLAAKQSAPLFFDSWGYQFEELKLLFEMFTPKPDVLIIDYIQLIAADDKMTRRDSITEYLRLLKELAMHHKIALVVLSQLNRGTHDQKQSRPTLRHLKESGSLEECADSVWLLWWKSMEELPMTIRGGDGEDQVMVDQNEQTEYHIIVAKQRHGPTGYVPLKFHPQRFRFSTIPAVGFGGTP